MCDDTCYTLHNHAYFMGLIFHGELIIHENWTL